MLKTRPRLTWPMCCAWWPATEPKRWDWKRVWGFIKGKNAGGNTVEFKSRPKWEHQKIMLTCCLTNRTFNPFGKTYVLYDENDRPFIFWSGQLHQHRGEALKHLLLKGPSSQTAVACMHVDHVGGCALCLIITWPGVHKVSYLFCGGWAKARWRFGMDCKAAATNTLETARL